MDKVKDFLNWSKIIFPDRTILRTDLDHMNWQQIRAIGNLEVKTHEEDEETETVILFV